MMQSLEDRLASSHDEASLANNSSLTGFAVGRDILLGFGEGRALANSSLQD
ncbi:MAG: hypothetical protein ABL921_12155 [Pirellula sp.]